MRYIFKAGITPSLFILQDNQTKILYFIQNDKLQPSKQVSDAVEAIVRKFVP
jgi:hypothetical protein